ncbi:MAG: hypothetical protein A2583_01375 [Bdellovibrionales bacterium RIFOXYD1_FULL_53_11]|nr:MAG: hypothetical protein A2583_01375 [Bdellovibrionales bacterium RIFOXYD1_FULL_53_11]
MMPAESEFLLELQHAFLQEASDLLAAVEDSFIRMEQNPSDGPEFEKILRLFHNMKGSAAAVGFEGLSAFSHKVENLLVAVRSKTVRLDGAIVDVLLSCNDRMSKFISALGRDFSASVDTEDVVRNIEKIMGAAAAPSGPPPTAPTAPSIDSQLLQDFMADVTENLEAMDGNLVTLEKEPANREAVESLLRSFHTMKSASGILGFPALEGLAHEVESLLEKMRDGAGEFTKHAASVCLDAVSIIRAMSAWAKDGECGPLCSGTPEMSALLVRLRGECRVHVPEAAVPTVEGAVKTITGAAIREGIKVDADRLDRLVDTIGELVIAEAMVAQSKEIMELQGALILHKHLDHLNKITRNLQEIGMALRMVPIRHTFRKMVRIVRDLSKKLGKDVELKITGDDTELDKTVADRIGDPLVHMVRNAVDHGIEKTADERTLRGKSPQGTVQLRAFHKGGSVCIEIEDDGRGLDRGRLIEKAIEKGIIQTADGMSDREIFSLVFHSGFSTAEKVTDVSGRGVGMDVVKKNIEEIHGQVEIRSEKGRGSVFCLRIPHTLAIIEGMVITVGEDIYVIPTYSILSSVKPSKADIATASGARAEMIRYQGRLLPLFRLSRFYNISAASEEIDKSIVLIVEEDGRRVGLMVDGILRQQQFVIKPLGDFMRGVPGVSGGTIMPDGTVGLILDVGSLLVQFGSKAAVNAV